MLKKCSFVLIVLFVFMANIFAVGSNNVKIATYLEKIDDSKGTDSNIVDDMGLRKDIKIEDFENAFERDNSNKKNNVREKDTKSIKKNPIRSSNDNNKNKIDLAIEKGVDVCKNIMYNYNEFVTCLKNNIKNEM